MICLVFLIVLAPSTQIVPQLEWDWTVAEQHKQFPAPLARRCVSVYAVPQAPLYRVQSDAPSFPA